MKECPICHTENPSKATHCMKCGTMIVGVEDLSVEEKLRLKLTEAEKKISRLETALDNQIKLCEDAKKRLAQLEQNVVAPKEVVCPENSPKKKKDVSHTIIYEAAVKLNTPWIDKNSVLHEFANGKGKIRLMDSVTKIGDEAFSGCSEMTSIVIPDWVTEIGWCAFAACDSLEEIIIPEGTRNKFEELLYGYKNKFVEQ